MGRRHRPPPERSSAIAAGYVLFRSPFFASSRSPRLCCSAALLIRDSSCYHLPCQSPGENEARASGACCTCERALGLPVNIYRKGKGSSRGEDCGAGTGSSEASRRREQEQEKAESMVGVVGGSGGSSLIAARVCVSNKTIFIRCETQNKTNAQNQHPRASTTTRTSDFG